MLQILNFIAILILAGISLNKTLSEKKSWVIKSIYFFCFIFSTGLGVWNGAHQTVSIMEHSSVSEGNISFEPEKMNILIHPKYPVSEVEGLKVRDTTFSLQKNEDYEMKPSNVIKIRWIYNNNFIDNKSLAERGFALSYKAKFYIFDPRYWMLKFKK